MSAMSGIATMLAMRGEDASEWRVVTHPSGVVLLHDGGLRAITLADLEEQTSMVPTVNRATWS